MRDSETLIKQAFERPGWYVTKSAYNIRIRIETIREFIQNLKPVSILDIGCGDGSLSLGVLSPENRLTLVDRSKSMLDLARSRIPKGMEDRVYIKNEDFMGASLPEGSFDLVLCVGVLAYVEDRRSFIKKLVSLLRPGGTVIIECTDGGHFITRFNRFYDFVRTRFGGSEFPVIIRPASEVPTILKEFGFTACNTFRYSRPLPVMGKLLSQEMSYRMIRWIHGAASKNRAAWLGSECLFHFKPKDHSRQPSPQPGRVAICEKA